MRKGLLLLPLIAFAFGCGGGGGKGGGTPATYSVGGNATGVSGTGLVLRNNGGDDLAVNANGTFTFATRLNNEQAYAVTVAASPAGQSCTVTNGTGTIASANVTNVVVTCASGAFRVGGAVAGLGNATGLVLHSSDGQDLPIAPGATSYEFPNRFADGTYAVTVTSVPAGLTCGVERGDAVVVAGADITDMDVTCRAITFTVGGEVVGMPANTQLTLRNNGGDDVIVASGLPTFTFPTPVANGAGYAVTIATQPSGAVCTVQSGTGTVALANVTSVRVNCGPATFTIGGSVGGLAATGLRIGTNVPGAAQVTVPSTATSWTLANVPNGTYQLTIAAQPTGVTCAFGNNQTTSSVTVTNAAVTNANVTCVGVVVQRWDAPATWGGSANAFWDDADPLLVSHTRMTVTGPVETRIPGSTWSFVGGTAPTPQQLDAFPAGPRYGVGPFPTEGMRYEASAPNANLDIEGDMIVCAVVQPDHDAIRDYFERPIFSKGVGHRTDAIAGGGWSLMQMHAAYCFHYEVRNANGQTQNAMAFTQSFSANQDAYGLAQTPRGEQTLDVNPLPSWVVVCGGRDGNRIAVAVNSVPDTLATTTFGAAYGPAPHVLDAASDVPATIGGYTRTFTEGQHVFRGRVYETAVWRQAATPENLQAKLAAVLGLANGVTYTRNRPAPVVDATGDFHMTWRHSPRFEATKGVLVGLQSWNRVNYWMAGALEQDDPMTFAASEDLRLWVAENGATVVKGDKPSPTGVGNTASLVTLPATDSRLHIPLAQGLPNPNVGGTVTQVAPWGSSGIVHGQIWLRVDTAQPAGSILRVRKTAPDPLNSNPVKDHYDINLASLTPNVWTRVWLNGDRGGVDPGGSLSAQGDTAGELFLENPGPGPISFNAWGVQLTQIGDGGDLNPMTTLPFSLPSPDLGPLMYDWSTSNDIAGSFAPWFVQDVLQPPAISGSTAASGFCMSVDAQPYDTLTWDFRIHASRTPLAWANHADPRQVTRVMRLFLHGLDLQGGNGVAANRGKICFGTRTLATPGDWSTVQPEEVVACGEIPAGWTAGSRHNLKACSTPAGQLSIYADYGTGNTTPIATGTLANVPDLNGGRLLIGNGTNGVFTFASPWHGYISRAAVCRATDIAACQ